VKYIITDDTQQRPSTSRIQTSRRLTDDYSDTLFSMAPRLQKVVHKTRRNDTEISRCIKYENKI
jgi:uncharacterized membrane protein